MTKADRIEAARAGKLQVPHGLGGYTNYGCRCSVCRDAAREWQRQRRSRRLMEGFDDQQHGTQTAYSAGCRCDVCVETYKRLAATRWQRMNRATQEGAHRKGYEWTGPELEVLTRCDLTQPQKAAMLGRTLAGVVRQMGLIRLGERRP